MYLLSMHLVHDPSTSTEGNTPKGVPHRVQGSVGAAETPPNGLMPQSHLAPFTSFHGAAHRVCLGPQPPPVFSPSTVTGSRHCITDCVSPGDMQCRPQLGRGQSDTPGSGVPLLSVLQQRTKPWQTVANFESAKFVF